MRLDHARLVLSIVTSASLATTACGADLPAGNPEVASREVARGDELRRLDDALDPSEAVPSLRFSVPLPGVHPPLEATIAGEPVGQITVAEYPARATLPARFGALPADFEGAFSDSFCGRVREQAAVARAGGIGARLAQRFVRGGADVPVHVTASPFVGPAFEAALLGAARDAGATQTDVGLANPIAPEGLGISVALAPDATTHLLGKIEALTAGIERQFARQIDFVAASGTFGAAIVAKDLLCDLAAGKATITVRLRGTDGSRAHDVETVSTGLAPL